MHQLAILILALLMWGGSAKATSYIYPVVNPKLSGSADFSGITNPSDVLSQLGGISSSTIAGATDYTSYFSGVGKSRTSGTSDYSLTAPWSGITGAPAFITSTGTVPSTFYVPYSQILNMPSFVSSTNGVSIGQTITNGTGAFSVLSQNGQPISMAADSGIMLGQYGYIVLGGNGYIRTSLNGGIYTGVSGNIQTGDYSSIENNSGQTAILVGGTEAVVTGSYNGMYAGRSGTASVSSSGPGGAFGSAAYTSSTSYDVNGAAASAQSYSIQRANHTGTQSPSTISSGTFGVGVVSQDLGMTITGGTSLNFYDASHTIQHFSGGGGSGTLTSATSTSTGLTLAATGSTVILSGTPFSANELTDSLGNYVDFEYSNNFTGGTGGAIYGVYSSVLFGAPYLYGNGSHITGTTSMTVPGSNVSGTVSKASSASTATSLFYLSGFHTFAWDGSSNWSAGYGEGLYSSGTITAYSPTHTTTAYFTGDGFYGSATGLTGTASSLSIPWANVISPPSFITSTGTAAMITGTIPATQVSGTIASSGTANYATLSGTSVFSGSTGAVSSLNVYVPSTSGTVGFVSNSGSYVPQSASNVSLNGTNSNITINSGSSSISLTGSGSLSFSASNPPQPYDSNETRLVQWSETSLTTTGNASGSVTGPSGYRLRSGTGSSYAQLNLASDFSSTTEFTGNRTNIGSYKMMFSWRFSRITGSGKTYFHVGRLSTTPQSLQASDTGFGLEVDTSGTAHFVCANGTTLNTGIAVDLHYYTYDYQVNIYSDGAGNFTWSIGYLSINSYTAPTVVETITGGPTGQFSREMFECDVIASGSNTDSNITYVKKPKITLWY